MAFSIPDGTTIHLGTTFGTSVTITGISNAARLPTSAWRCTAARSGSAIFHERSGTTSATS